MGDVMTLRVFALGGAVAGAIAMVALLTLPPVDPPGATPIRSTTADGQVLERFEIRPTDIIARTSDGGVPTRPFPADIGRIGGPATGSSVLTAKLRDARGTVVGIASRYTLTTGDSHHADRLWALVITRRGTLATRCPADATVPCGTVLGGTGTFATFRGRLQDDDRDDGYELTLTGTGERR